MGGIFTKPKDDSPGPQSTDTAAQNTVLHRDLSNVPPSWNVWDSSGGAAVSCFGHAFQPRIWAAVARSMDYAATTTFTAEVVGQLCEKLVNTTNGTMARAVIYNSGTDANEAAVKLSRQYQQAKGEDRSHFISREQSYHGAGGFSLALSGHRARREQFEPMINMQRFHKVSSCFDYLQRDDRTIEQFVSDKKQELEGKFREIGHGKVAAFFCETIVGAALGCAPAVKGYLLAMQEVCHAHGALFVLDEIMCGMGRTGKHLHAFLHHEGVRPDILVIGKALGAGCMPVSAMLCSQAIIDVLGDESFNHGYTFQNHPPSCTAALEVLKIIEEYNLLENVDRQGKYLQQLMCEKIERLPHVSPIRGQGFFQGFSLVKDKATKTSFDRKLHVAQAIQEKGKDPKYGIYVYYGTGSAEDGLSGDHIMIAPPYTATREKIEWFVDRLERLLIDYFAELDVQLTEK
ncbi:hypothetical protein GRF29_69g1769662 [Pseudopithomyces chartarum]|uniref:Aminotransferase n=1 Tax=Pseudopithomyces chartarum TaxID=1892770 RepID=A0AAN6RHZ6_9PLEO|nr:hypothetical protein GRF29_69g1769662 [Pseudopithomyces chartarum]